MSDPAPAIQLVLDDEGSGYVYEDYGRGPSKWGITLKTYRIFYPDAKPMDIHILDRDAAAAFYKMAFWDMFHIWEIDDQSLANKILNLAVNPGPGEAIRFLQVACGAVPDGILGQDTAKLVNAADPHQVLSRVRAQAEVYFRQRAAENPAKQKELAGWLARLAK